MSGAVTVIETPRLRLRTASADDGAFFLGLVNEPTWLATIGDRHIHTVDAARAALETGPIAQQQELGYSFYIVEHRGDGVAIGMCGLIKRATMPGPDIGYALLPAYCGQGLAWEAASSVVRHARDVMCLPAVYGLVSPQNQPSINLINKLGLRFERFSRQPVAGKDINIYRKSFS